MELLAPILTGNLGTFILLFVAWKSGLLSYLIDNKNGHIKINQKLDKISGNELSHVEEHLQDIKKSLDNQSSKLNKVIDNTTYIKARLNGRDN